jgi:hypothetical protein
MPRLLVLALFASTAFAATSDLSPADKIKVAAESVEGIEAVHKQAIDRQTAANDAQDFVQLNCVRDKLSQVRGLLKLAERAKTSLTEAIGAKDRELVDHELSKIEIASTRAKTLQSEMDVCVGESSHYTGATVLDFKIEGDQRKDDPTDEPLAGLLDSIQTDRPDDSDPEDFTITPSE